MSDRPALTEAPATGPEGRAEHLLIAHASALSDAARAALGQLALPRLDELLARLAPQAPPSSLDADAAGSADEAPDEYSFSPPHEAELARLHGWKGADGCWPWAAAMATDDGVIDSVTDGSRGPGAWALVTPVHWQVGSDQVTLLDPALLELDESESRALHAAVLPSFEAEGWQLLWGAPLRWYARHDSLGALRTAALDRVIGRDLDLWLGKDPQARRVRRLQVEAQMIWHDHPVNGAREAGRRWVVNSFWLSGCGTAQPRRAPAGLQVDDRLRAPLLAGDWHAWIDAWHALDAGPVADLLARIDRGEAVRLTLCGERGVRRWASASSRPWWQALRQRLGGPPRGLAQQALQEL